MLCGIPTNLDDKMKDLIMIMFLPLVMVLGWFFTRESEEVVITTDDCIVQLRDELNRYPDPDEWRMIREHCWITMGASVNDADDL